MGEAETLPENLDDYDVSWWSDVLQLGAGSEHGLAVAVDSGVGSCGGCAPGASDQDTRWLPPGSMFEYWQQYNSLYTDHKCSFRYFWAIWERDWKHRLKFRQKLQHAVCPTCVQHKLLIRQLGGDAIRRQKQVEAFQAHKEDQRKDRQVYWRLRAEARLDRTVVVLIIDGMDQAKFAYPRAECLKSKDLEGLQRPRLHVNGCIVHGHDVLVAVSRADFSKGTNVTCELIAHSLTRLKNRGLDLTHACVHVQLDNTSSSNKNNHLVRFMASVVGSGRVAAMQANFLRKGHTHEDIDQLFGRLASWIVRHHTVQTPEQYVTVIQSFLDTLVERPWPQRPEHRTAFLLTQVCVRA